MIFQAVTERWVTQLVSLAEHTRFYLSTNGFHDPSLTLDWLAQHFGRIFFLSHFSAAECISGTVLHTDLLAEAVLAEGRMFPCILCWSVWECGVDNMRDYVMALHLFLLWSDLFFLLSQQKQVSCRFLVHLTQPRFSVVKKRYKKPPTKRNTQPN